MYHIKSQVEDFGSTIFFYLILRYFTFLKFCLFLRYFTFTYVWSKIPVPSLKVLPFSVLQKDLLCTLRRRHRLWV